MALKTFNIEDSIYKEFSKHCKKHGISMSKRIENFIREELGRINAMRPASGVLPKTDKPQVSVEKQPVSVEKQPVSVEKHSFSKYC